MKLNYKRTFLVGFAFLSISAFWQMYDTIIPLIMRDTYHLGDGPAQRVAGEVVRAGRLLRAHVPDQRAGGGLDRQGLVVAGQRGEVEQEQRLVGAEFARQFLEQQDRAAVARDEEDRRARAAGLDRYDGRVPGRFGRRVRHIFHACNNIVVIRLWPGVCPDLRHYT